MNTSIEMNKKLRRSIQLQLFALILLLMGSKGAWATCTGGGQTIALSLPATVSVARDLPVGSLLTTWVQSSQTSNIWSCNWPNANYGVRAQTGPVATGNSGGTYSYGGVTYTVWNTNVQGVGIAVGRNLIFTAQTCTYKGGWTGWGSTANSWAGLACGGPGYAASGTAGAQVQVALVKTSSQAQSGLISGIAVQLAPIDNNATQTQLANSYTINVQINALACTTPDVLVPLGTHSPNEMASVGAGTTPVSFTVKLNNCPGGATVSGTQAGMIHGVQYRIDPVTTVVNSAQSVVALNSGSSASGVGVQLLNSAGTAAFPLSSWQTLSGFSGSADGNYTVPLSARYYRTGTISAGTANSSMTFTMQYL
ncbi:MULTISPECIES: fimbrial protein [unclassified Dyella]|uniref:fimbrial protein n=1 Tax=unclassified Dyella TaxID=2634549 RepID=UPI000CC23E7F|nr:MULTISPECIES: fimbrial protein [unclassified Dyella]MDR3444076.1 fimbrial protein [Dyella sp.]PMQ06336.1 S-fimbrial protein subunit SfaA [Dyella sp. AD56]